MGGHPLPFLMKMASAVAPATKSHQEVSPPPGKHQFSAVVEGQLVVCGGMIEGRTTEIREALSFRNVYTFDPSCEHWTKHSASGDYPSTMLYSGASAAVNQFLYIYGGRTEFAYYGFSPYYGGLHCLDVHTWTWTKLSFPRGPLSVHSERGPPAKVECRMLCHEKELVLFGGRRTVGHSIGKQSGASYVNGWTNELHTFDVTKSEGK